MLNVLESRLLNQLKPTKPHGKVKFEKARVRNIIADRIVDRIEKDLNDRKGFDLDSLEGPIREEIRGKWKRIIVEALNG